MNAAADGTLFPGSLAASLLGAAWAWLLVTLLGAAILRPVARRQDAAALAVWPVVGTGAFGVLALLGSLAGALSPRGVVAGAALLTVACAAAAHRDVASAVMEGLRGARTFASASRPAALLAALALLAPIALASLHSVVPTLHYDDHVYHLGLPEQALLTSHWPLQVYFHHSVMPAAWETLFLVPLALGGGLGPQLLGLFSIAAFAAVVVRLARRGATDVAPALVAAALLVASGVVLAFAWVAGNDAFVGLAVAAALAETLDGEGRRASLLVAGLCCGAALAAKYSSIPGVAGIVLVAALAPRLAPGRRVAAAILVGAAALAFAAPWLLRAAAATGNPVYPQLHRVLGGEPWDDSSAALMSRDGTKGAWPDRGPAALALSIADVAVASDRLGAPSGLSPAFFLPALAGLLLLRRVRDGRRLLAFIAVAHVGWAATALMLRFALPQLAALAPFAAAAFAVPARHPKGRSALALAAAVLAVLGWLAALQLHYVRQGLDPKDVLRRRDTILRDALAEAALAPVLARELPPDATLLLVGNCRVALMPRAVLASSALDPPLVGALLRGAKDASDVDARLRAAGITHVVVDPSEIRRFIASYAWDERAGRDTAAALQAWVLARHPAVSGGGVYVVPVAPAPPGGR